MDTFRRERLTLVSRIEVAAVEDYLTSVRFEDGAETCIDLPRSNVLKYHLADGSWFCLLPSGTEPKAKFAIHKVFDAEHNTIDIPTAQADKIDTLNLIVRKSTHIMAFGFLAFLLLKSLEPRRYSYLLSRVITFVYAISDEYKRNNLKFLVSQKSYIFFKKEDNTNINSF